LALAGLIGAAKMRGTAISRVAVSAATLVIVAIAVAAPPRFDLFGQSLQMPSRWLYAATPTWRVLGRLIIVTEVGLAVLAGLGTWVILRSQARGRQMLMGAAVTVVVLLDLWPRPRTFVNLSPPPSVRSLAKLAPGIVANYPLQPEGQTNMDARFFQQAMRHPLLNGYPSGSGDEASALSLADLTRPNSLDGLWVRGVRYVLVSQPVAIPLPESGLRPVAADKRYALYSLTSRGVVASVVPSDGFGAPEPGWWMQNAVGTLDVWSACACRLRITLQMSSYGTERRVSISAGKRRFSAVAPVLSSRRMSFDIDVPRKNSRSDVTLRSSPGPQAIDGPDPREVGVRIDAISVDRVTASTSSGTH
jgi:hypothetical protein